MEVDFFCATEVLFFCEERFWATCFFEEGFLLLATEVLLVAFFEATVVRFLLETALCFELDRALQSLFLASIEKAARNASDGLFDGGSRFEKCVFRQ